MRVKVAIAAMTLSIVAPASAQLEVSGWVEIDAFPKSGTTQHMPQWCWAASLEMVFRHYGVDRTQEQIVVATYGALVNLPAFAPQQLYRTLNAVSFRRDGGVDVTVGQFGWGAPVPADLLEELRQDHPVVAWYRNPGGAGGHAVVVYGANYTTSPVGPIVNAIKLYDPWPGQGERVVPANALASAMSNYFVVRSVTAGASPGRPVARDTCEYANDGTCDEPDLCPRGTDGADCAGARPPVLPFPADRPPMQLYCCDAFGNRRCLITSNPGPPGSTCGCPGQGYGVTCM
jgi:hypothetical protein